MRIGILQADAVMEQFQPAHGNYPGMIAGILGRAATELNLDVECRNYDVEHGIYPNATDECDAYVITGSKKSVYDDDPWIAALKEYTCELHQEEKKLVGLCFGHQLVAEALGGKTLGADVGWCVGIHESEVIQPQWFMSDDELDRFQLIVSHKDQVVQLPEGAQLLASAEQCPNSMYCVGDHILTMQGHPEFTREYSRDLMDMRREILGVETYNEGVASLAKTLEKDIVARWIIRFIKGKPAAE
ncbi:MAG: GMP synthase [Gammaproteobacteria bacterium]|nr:GMP synthase [Gammaproteobacteria bacterium]MBT5685389.1 GMP synthase [Gammaproteobacteria bacterium]MBT6586321.1 GMP synthase [Gammaproteobacteria bacterium]MBT7876835.1 GMP synthase [Gammaproteobacteria bacterium]MDG1231112.1 amidotransferase [Pseudomonadales bacterium]